MFLFMNDLYVFAPFFFWVFLLSTKMVYFLQLSLKLKSFWQLEIHRNLIIQKLVLVLMLMFNSEMEFNMLLFNNNILLNKFMTQVDIALIIVCMMYAISIKMSTYKISLFSVEVFLFLEIAVLGLWLLLKMFNMVIFFMNFELQTFCLYGLALLSKNSLLSNESGLKYFITGAFISSIFMLGGSFCYGFYGSLNLLELSIMTEEKNFFFNFYSVCIIGLIFYKLGFFPLGQWMPDVYEASQNIVTFFFSLVPKIMYFFFIIMLFNFWLEMSLYSLSWMMKMVSLLSISMGAILSLNQVKVKSLLTYSGIVQSGYVILGISLHNLNSLMASLFFLIMYMSSVYLVWNILLNLDKKQQVLYTTDFIGLNKSNPMISLGLMFLFLNFAGLPPFLGFFSKLMILDQIMVENLYLTAMLLMLTSSLTIFYYLKITYMLYFSGMNNYLYNFLHQNLNIKNYIFNFNSSSICMFILLLGFLNSHYIMMSLFKLVLTLVN